MLIDGSHVHRSANKEPMRSKSESSWRMSQSAEPEERGHETLPRDSDPSDGRPAVGSLGCVWQRLRLRSTATC